jgi:hypothetical protein
VLCLQMGPGGTHTETASGGASTPACVLSEITISANTFLFGFTALLIRLCPWELQYRSDKERCHLLCRPGM